ncbi:unnamed protein product [Dicrocoelium dendriticum]|nr:unnamed protein product [Dicrocoelium dendriticum]
MESKENYALRVCAPLLTRDLDPMDVLDNLLSENWISDTEYDHIRRLCSKDQLKAASSKLLELLRPRSAGAFECFVSALESHGSHIAPVLREHFSHAPEGRRREHSLSDLRETLIDGAVPDVPIQYLNRRKMVENLATALRALARRFRVNELNEVTNKMPDLNLGFGGDVPINGTHPTFNLTTSSSPNWHPPPTNAWLLIHGMAGCGKTVLCTSVLRQHPALLAEEFPGGVIWLPVGSMASPSESPNAPYSPSGRKAINSQLIFMVDCLERKVSSSAPHSFADTSWSDFQYNSPPRPHSPLSVSPPTSSASIHESLDRLRRALMRRQHRTTWGPDEQNRPSISLLLIVLDDVWDLDIGRILAGMPAAFLVTSRDQNVLQYVETPVDRFPVYDDLMDDEVAHLLSTWTDHPPTLYLPPPAPTTASTASAINLYPLARLCHGLPFAVTLLGYWLRENYHRLSDYEGDPLGSGSPVLNWLVIRRPSAYPHDTLLSALQKTLLHLSTEYQSLYEHLVIFDANIVLTAKVASILWALEEDVAEMVFKEFTRFSLITRFWSQNTCCYGYVMHALQLDLLRLFIPPTRQAAFHARFVENYEHLCNGQWSRLIPTTDHVYFWHQATMHLYHSGRLDKLADLMTNLDFLRCRLALLGTSPIIAEFYRYRAVFATLDRMSDWHAYLRFIQTNAYFIIDPVTIQPTMRGRSPYRRNSSSKSCLNLGSLSPPKLRADSGLPTPTGRPTLVALSRIPTAAAATAAQGPKGLHLIQLGLGLPQHSPVFQQAVQWILHKTLRKGTLTESPRISEYYWFWCNSHVAASQLVWAIPTGPHAITCLATESPPTDETGPMVRSHASIGAARERILASTRDGRVLLLDAASGYEVAVQQTYPPDVEVKFLRFLSNNSECLTCGSNGSLVVSTLPPPEPLEREHHPSQNDEDTDVFDSIRPKDRSPLVRRADLMGGFDVDAEEEERFYEPRPRSYSLFDDRSSDGMGSWTSDGHKPSDAGDTGDASRIGWGRRGSAPSPLLAGPTDKFKAPTVLAEIPRLTEVVRVDGNNRISDIVSHSADSPTSYTLHCIAAPHDLDIVVLSGEGTPNLNVHRVDSFTSPEQAGASVLLPAVYYLKRTANQLYLDCSRQLRLPPLTSENPMSQLMLKSGVRTLVTAISADARDIAVGLDNGHIWLYNLDSISWIACLSTHVAMHYATESDRMANNTMVSTPKQQLPPITELSIGPAPTCCLFLPSFDNEAPATTSEPDIQEPTPFAAAVGSRVLVWYIPSTAPRDENELASPESVLQLSKPCLCLTASLNADVLTMDTCVLAGQPVLAGGTTNGRVVFWRLRDGYRLSELSAHSTWVTSVRLLPSSIGHLADSTDHDFRQVHINNLPICVLTASANGVIKRWDVGAACLPSPTTPLSLGPVWPCNSTTPTPSARHSSIESNMPSMESTALHGLWTGVFSVWFDPHGALMVVGRRRHSPDLQFLFRPEQGSSGITEAISGGSTLTFQEVTIKPSQPFYWKHSQRSSIPMSPPEHGDPATPKAEDQRDITASAAICASPPATRTRPPLAPSKHWIVTTGLAGAMGGKATAVSFWPNGLWVAVGFSTGLVQVFSLHFDRARLFGVVKRYCLVDSRPSTGQHASAPNRLAKSLDRVVHLHTWQSLSADGDYLSLVVVAVFANGSVRFWHIDSVTHGSFNLDSGCPEIGPVGVWPRMHSLDSPDSKSIRRFSDIEVQSRVITDTDITDLVFPITWSALKRIPYSSTCEASLPTSTASPTSPSGKRTRCILVWLTAGQDGMVFGRQVVLPPPTSDNGDDDEVAKRPNRDFPPWRFDLAAHRPWVITDADVDPSGRWLVTSSTDKTVKVWSLASSNMVFETDKHPACVRAVCFRPVLDEPEDSPDADWYFATGDDSGVLRIWRLSSDTLQDENDNLDFVKQLNRAVSPDTYSLARPGSVLANHHPVRYLHRFPSPEINQSGVGVSETRTASTPPLFSSNAAGTGGSWLRRLVWSPDGALLAGLSDRLCVWPFDASSVEPIKSRDSRNLQTLSPLDRIGLRRDSARPRHPRRQAKLNRCRVLRVLSSGVSDTQNCSLSLLQVSARRTCQILSNGAQSSLSASFRPLSLPPTLVTVDVNTGTLYIFDPIGALFLSQM